jgi:hypothetical protein
MKFEPIHELPATELDFIISNARKFLEWNIEPKYCHLNALIDSIKRSLIHFLPDDEDLIKDINDANEATLIIKTCFINEPHPLKDGLIALREIFNVINADGKNFDSLKIKWAINDYQTSIKPFYLDEKLSKFQLMQSKKAKKPRTRNGMTPEERTERNNKIIEHFKRTHLSQSSFATKHEAKYALKPRSIRLILSKTLGS